MAEAGRTIENNEIRFQIDKMMRGGQFKKAIELCQSALKIDPTNPDLHVRLGDLYVDWHLDIYQAKQYLEEAITEYQRAMETNLYSPVIHYKIGVALYHNGEFDKAIGHFNLCIEYDENMADAYFMIARTLAKKDRLSEAVPYLKKAIKKGHLKSSRSHYLMHLLLKSKYNVDFKQKIQSDGHFLMALFSLPFDKDAQKELFTKLSYAKFIPVFVKGYFLEKSKNIYKAIDLYSETIEEAPGFLPLYVLLGDAYRTIGKVTDAINEYKMAIWIDSTNVIAFKALCALYEEQGNYDSAADIYKKLIYMHPNDPLLYSNLANILYLKGDVKEAISHYQTAITLNPNKNWTSVIAQTLGYVLQESKENYDAAISAYQSASILNPNDTDIYISLGSAFYDKGDHNNALTVYRGALEINPNNSKIHCNLGYLLWGKGLIDESIKEYETAIRLDSTYDIAYNNLGVIYLDDLGRIVNAMDLFNLAIKHNPNYALAYYNLARAVSIKGDKLEAARLFQVSLDLNSYTKELDENDIKSKIDDLFD
ncbi:MAG: tetratricopeptide repeat protein [Candidatus Gastranaerophilales bacterium]|nr:tetratricopeptide repeat protein [Candidatus Gastranaerophilales bacterium]